MRPLRGCHFRPELRDGYRGEVALDVEKASVDVGFHGGATQVVVIGEVQLAVRPPYGRDRLGLAEVALPVFCQLLELLPFVMDLDEADGNLGGSQTVDLDLVQLCHLPSSQRATGVITS